MAGGKFCLNRRHGITGAKHEAEVARRKRQHGRRGQAKSEEETTASDAHTSSLSRWPASVLIDCRKATLPQSSPPRERRSACPMLGKRLPFPIGRRSGCGYLNSNLLFRLVKKLACFFVRWLS